MVSSLLPLSIQQDILLGLGPDIPRVHLLLLPMLSITCHLEHSRGFPLSSASTLSSHPPPSGNFHHSSQREAVLKSQITFPSPSSTQNLSMASHFSQSKLTNPSCGLSPPRPPGPPPCLSLAGCCAAPGAVASSAPSIIHPWCRSSPCLGCSSLRWARVSSLYPELCAQL